LSQVLASPGDVITITGQHFVKVKSVKFGSTAATFKVISKTEIQATVPADFNSYALIVVETEFGVSAPSGIGLKYFLYDDSLKGTGGGWGGQLTLESTEKVSRGTHSIKKVIGSWEGLTLQFDTPQYTTDYQFVKMSIFPTESTKIFVNINSGDLYNSDNGTTVTLIPGQWNHISIPISALHPDLIAGDKFDAMLIQEFSNGALTPGSTFYIDDIGFL
ncbi:IPT/TIG domain-containing protein, partial [Flavobacterium sp.]|uniref:IPT/TIG domain-containing protein n=1 Tax=Flavobacterium sp. TaxID=239 RepID=UPI002CBC6B52